MHGNDVKCMVKMSEGYFTNLRVHFKYNFLYIWLMNSVISILYGGYY